jgi:predicted N-acetyltransferase YhbS
MDLAGGYELRVARDRDIEQVSELVAARGEAADAVDLRLVVEDPAEGLESCLVVVYGDRIVSTATLLHDTVRIDEVEVPAGQVELVATASDHEGRGLVRALMHEAHRRSAARGDLMQIMIGIPFFYRQFGYAYAMPIPRRRTVREVPIVAEPAITIRRATHDDIAAMQRLQDEVQTSIDVAMPHSSACWRWLVERDGSAQWLAERDSRPVAVCRATPSPEDTVISELAGSSDGVTALIAHADATRPVFVQERPHAAFQATIEELVTPVDGVAALHDWYYGRIEHLAPLLDRLAPVLIGRAERAGLLDRPHDVLVSSFRSHVRFTIGPDGMTPVIAGGSEQAPVSKGGSGIPPDALAPLLLGPHGALGLEARLPDAWLGRQRDLMDVLFPPQRADLLTYYVAI